MDDKLGQLDRVCFLSGFIVSGSMGHLTFPVQEIYGNAESFAYAGDRHPYNASLVLLDSVIRRQKKYLFFFNRYGG